MSFVRRYWAAALILTMVTIHAVVIGYVRSRVARLTGMESLAVEIGEFRFQPIDAADQVVRFRLHVIVDPARARSAREQIMTMRMEIREEAEQMLRRIDPQCLSDPSQAQIRERLMEVVLRHLNEPVVQRVLITDWLHVPVASFATSLARR